MHIGKGLKKFYNQMFFYSSTDLFLQPTGDLSTFSLTETMIPCNPINRKIALIVFALSLVSFLQISAQDGRSFLIIIVRACHSSTKDMTGPKLGGVLERDPYNGDVSKIVNWVHNADKLTSSDPYYKGLKAQFGAQMTAFPGMPDKDIEAIVKYVSAPDAGTYNHGGTAT